MSVEEYLAVGTIFWMLVAIWWDQGPEESRTFSGFPFLFAMAHWVALTTVGLAS